MLIAKTTPQLTVVMPDQTVHRFTPVKTGKNDKDGSPEVVGVLRIATEDEAMKIKKATKVPLLVKQVKKVRV
jgi:hypothetical protein